MKSVGIIKEFDKLGRLVIPKDMRDRFALEGKVELVLTDKGVFLRSPEYMLIRKNK